MSLSVKESKAEAVWGRLKQAEVQRACAGERKRRCKYRRSRKAEKQWMPRRKEARCWVAGGKEARGATSRESGGVRWLRCAAMRFEKQQRWQAWGSLRKLPSVGSRL